MSCAWVLGSMPSKVPDVPPREKRTVWSEYRPGQEIDKRPSRSWHRAADAAIEAVAQRELIERSRYL